jgi:hypothetical protein
MSWNDEIKNRLAELRRKLVTLQVQEGTWRTAGVAGAVLLLVVCVELVFPLSSAARGIVLWAWLTTVTGLTGVWILLPVLQHLFRPIHEEILALRWGRSLPEVNDRLLNAIQVWENRLTDQASPELAELSLSAIGQQLQGASYERVLDRRKLRALRRVVLIEAGCWVVAMLVTWGSFGSAFARLWQPGRDFGPVMPYTLKLEEVPKLTIRGEPFEVLVRGQLSGNMPGTLPAWITLRVRELNGETSDFQLKFDGTGTARQSIENPQDHLSIWAFKNNITSDTVEVRVKARPFIKELQVKWTPPAYSGQPPGSAIEKRGDVSALKGSRVSITLEADRDLAKAQLRLVKDTLPDQPDSLPMQVQGSQANAQFTLMESGHYNLILEDQEGIAGATPVDYTLWTIEDEPPLIEIIYPPGDAEINESMLIPIKGQAQDDFAITRVRLGYEIIKNGSADSSPRDNKFNWTNLSFEAMGGGSFLVDHLWDLTGLPLLPGDEILYRLEAQDNDQISGPKLALSPLQRLRFPSLEEIFARIDEGQGQQVESAQEALEKSKHLKQELDKLQEELKKNPNLPWEERKKVEEMLKKQEEVARQVEEMSKSAQEMIQRMEESRTLSDETLQKYQELQKLLSDVMTPELMSAMQKLQEALQKQDPEALRRAVEDFSLNQEQMLAKIEKTMNILKQLQLEMKLDELAKRAEELLQKQQEINDNLEKNGPHPEQARAEAELQKEMQAFEQEFNKAKEMLKESPHNPDEVMKQADSLMAENQFPETMEQMSQDMQQGSKQQAQQKGSKLQSGLAQLSQKMKEAKDQMTGAAKKELADALKKIAHDLLELSYQQESLLDTSNTMDKASPRFRAQAQEQQELKKFLEQSSAELFKQSQKSFFITPQIGAALDQAFKGMDQALQGYTARNPQSVQHQQQWAMGGLNRAVMEIGNSLSQMSSSSSSTGFSEMMEQLSKMAGQQGQINQGTMSHIPGPGNPGGMTQEQAAAMGRLAAEQEALARQLDQMNQANQELQQTMGRLGELGKEMQEVADALKERQVDERILKRQEKILTRLLDAQRSVREREYKKERISRTAEGNLFNPAPREADRNIGPDLARQRLLEALKEGYTKDYQQLIRDYFEALAREQK